MHYDDASLHVFDIMFYEVWLLLLFLDACISILTYKMYEYLISCFNEMFRLAFDSYSHKSNIVTLIIMYNG